ncbi:unnamed protein product [Acanthocheilonema viteae]|uniref:Uncharacterized protein n=1 Tax=Acanthocheilonema viteae TaxID=6277 RepID=A0A498SRH3_ACAVI|nr:unnamed protein product [Acanthocheilonema viteae]VBB33796.1 unnamed protein product [Acanthocheilonema viteae]VBB34915.1 unnamed protein product [Acanthocheilonema viteae]
MKDPPESVEASVLKRCASIQDSMIIATRVLRTFFGQRRATLHNGCLIGANKARKWIICCDQPHLAVQHRLAPLFLSRLF